MSDKNAKLKTPKGRFSYPHVFEPSARKNSDKKQYSVTLLFPKDKVDRKYFDDLIDQCVKENAPKGKRPRGMQEPISDGDSRDHEGREGYAGHWVVKFSCSDKQPPQVVLKNPAVHATPSQLKAGDWGRVSFGVGWYDMEEAKGVKFYLNNVQVLEEGESLGGYTQTEATDDFDDDESTDEDMGMPEDESDDVSKKFG